MSCCGNKRKEFTDQTRHPGRTEKVQSISRPATPNKPGRTFEYTGNQTLIVHGASSGKSYHFKFRGHRVQVDYTDSFALMAEKDLRIVH